VGQDNTEGLSAWLGYVKARLSTLEGAKALIEGSAAGPDCKVRSLGR